MGVVFFIFKQPLPPVKIYLTRARQKCLRIKIFIEIIFVMFAYYHLAFYLELLVTGEQINSTVTLNITTKDFSGFRHS